MTAFAPGSSIVGRDVFAGQVWTACPARVVADDWRPDSAWPRPELPPDIESV